MSITKIDGEMYRRMLCGAALALENKKDEINSLNVFPVPDGDTGTNMYMTIDAARTAKRKETKNLAEYSEASARDMMRAARGNSGVILSLFFRGVAKTFAGHEEADARLLTEAFRTGAEEARKAVLKPVEGTILTVMRECCRQRGKPYEDDLIKLMDSFHFAANETLKKTPEMLPALKRAKVVDSGGYGFTAVLDGMKKVLNEDINLDSGRQSYSTVSALTKPAADFSEYDSGEITFAFCTECLAARKPGVSAHKLNSLREYLSGIGDSVVMTEDDEIIKIHVHTNEPLSVLTRVMELGEIQLSKIENMRSQHDRLAGADENTVTVPEKAYGIIAVSNGDGLGAVFRELGADIIVAGGQSMNPSADDFLKALKNLSCENAIILPNNSNIVLTALQAARMAEGVHVEVVKSVTIPQGISALIAFDSDLDLDSNIKKMTKAMSEIKSLAITNAVKGMDGEKIKVKKNQIIGLVDNELRYACDSMDDCLRLLAGEIADKEIITVYCGKGVSDSEAEHASAVLQSALGSGHDIMTVPGGQPIYTYLISAE